MKETITGRVKRIISGSANAIVDAIEDMAPEMVMEQAIREVDSALDDVRAELGKVVAQKHLINKRLMDQNAKHEDLSDKITFAVKESRDDLAQTAIAQQLDIEAQIPILESSISENSAEEAELEGYVTALLAKRRQMQADLRDFRAAKAQAEKEGTSAAGVQTSKTGGVQSRVSQAESTFDRLMNKHAGVPGTGSPDAKSAAQLAELEDMSRAHRVEERLAAIKAQTTKESL